MSLSMPPERWRSGKPSIFKPLPGHVIGARLQQRLRGRFSPAERVKRNAVRVQIDLGSNQAVGPIRFHQEGPPHEMNLALLGGAAQEDHAPLQRSLQIGLPGGRKRATLRRSLHPLGSTLSVSRDVACRLQLQGGQRIMMKARPDLGLPATVEVLHSRLKPGLARRSKDGSDVQAQTETADATDGIRELVRPLKARVVIELSVSRQAEGAPMLQQSVSGSLRGDRCRA
jgi:hypothetical protein